MKPKRPLFVLSMLVVIAVVLYLISPFILAKMADLLVVRDKPEKAGLILVLGGDNNGERVRRAVELFQQGYS